MMMSVSKSLGRTVHYNNFTFYSTDGFGRDGYISYNNGGYWKDNLKSIIAKPKYSLNSKPVQSLGKLPPPVRYHSDGTGRDSYVIDREGGLVKNYSPINKIPLSYYLRNSQHTSRHSKQMTFYTQKESQTQALLNKIQTNVVNRLFHKEKNRFVLFNGKRKVEMLNNLNPFNPILRKSNSMSSVINNSKSPNHKNKQALVFSPSSKYIIPIVQKNMRTKYTTILHNSNQNQNNNNESH